MEVHFPPAVQEHLAHSAAKQGRDADELVLDVLVHYLADEARVSEMAASVTVEERRVASSHIEEEFLQAERGELINGDQARQQIQELKSRWLRGRAPKR